MSSSQQGAKLPSLPFLLSFLPHTFTSKNSFLPVHLGRRRCVDKRPTHEKRVNLKVDAVGFVVMRNSCLR